jgi:hypothetical protein
MLSTRIFLAIVGAAYVLLAAWCIVRPEQTSSSVGFELKPGSGQSEFLVIYGGLQIALGLAFLLPLARDLWTPFALVLCLIVHASLVVFRSASFLLFDDIPTTTYVLAASEWAILLGAAWRYCFRDRAASAHHAV